MAGIAGIHGRGKETTVERMLHTIAYRGEDGSKLIGGSEVAMGALWPRTQAGPENDALLQDAVWDANRSLEPDPETLAQEQEPFALAVSTGDGLFVARDRLGVRPLYYGLDGDGAMCFASEVKALMKVVDQIQEFPPGSWFQSGSGFHTFATVKPRPTLTETLDSIVIGLRERLEKSVAERVDADVMGAWLSGGLDSSGIAALARPHVNTLHTFATGFAGAPDLEYARQVADWLDTTHHEIVVTLDEVLDALPEVIYHLESFDALLVRSSITNYLASKRAAGFVRSVFSGEGADELFAGYAYLRDIDENELPGELVDITRRLHNTALQRVDRSASAHGMVARVPFLDSEVVDYAMRIPAGLKLRRNGGIVEKWVLRQSLNGLLPHTVLWRRKAKFWQGAGMKEQLAHHAERNISDADFARERTLPNGWTLNTKEELMYHRVFREQFGESDLSWMGRTKGAPVA